MRLVAGLVLVMVSAGAASAQSPYVGASFIGDIVRVSGSRSGDGSGSGETFGGALRAGVPLGGQWGVELEFARTGEVEAAPFGIPYATASSFTSTVTSATAFPPLDDVSLSFIPQFSSERRLSTISTLVWWSHDVSPRVSLVYLGGVAFTRADIETRITYPEFPVLPIPIPRPILPRAIEQETTTYGADVAVGFEGRIGMTDHLRLTPGIRLHSTPGGWSIRPGVGLQWGF